MEERTIAKCILDHVSGRIPVIAAGQIKTAEESVRALNLGLSLVAIGQAFVINPNWVSLVANGGHLEKSLSISKLPETFHT